jgi:hypothetical protein
MLLTGKAEAGHKMCFNPYTPDLVADDDTLQGDFYEA